MDYKEGMTCGECLKYRFCPVANHNANHEACMKITTKENYTIEQNAGENQIEGGVVGISGSVKWNDKLEGKKGLMENKISVENYLKYLDTKYLDESSLNWNPSLLNMKAEEEFKFFISLIRKIIESSSEISDEDKLYVRRYFDILVHEYWNKLQEQKYPTKPKYSAEQAFNVIRTMNCSLEDKLKVAELFEYMEK